MRASDADTGMRTGLEVGAGVDTLTQGTGQETTRLVEDMASRFLCGQSRSDRVYALSRL